MKTRSPLTLRFLSPDVLARISSLDLLARTVVEGFIAGLHRSPHLGFSIDFAEYRPYMPGDDPRTLDWKLLARTDRYYVKKFEGDTNTHVTLVLDVSASMGYGSGPLTKHEYACYLAASLAYLANRQQDGPGLIAFADRVLDRVPARQRPGQLRTILSRIEHLAPAEHTDVAGSLHAVTEIIKRRGILVVISDLYGEPDELVKNLKHLRFRGHDVIVFHILDDHELRFPFDQSMNLEDVETGEEMHVSPASLREEYLRMINAHIDRLRDECGKAEIDYLVVNTSEPLDFALFEYLSRRSKAH